MIRRTPVSRRRAVTMMLAGLGVLASACGPGTNPGAATKTESKPAAEAAKPAAEAAKPASSPAAAAASPAAAAASPAAAAASPAAAAASPVVAASGGPAPGTIKGPFEGEAKQVTGAGATFPAPLYSKWFNDYKTLTGVEVNYQAIGSGGGIKAISDQTADFGATDGPMTDEQLKAAKGGEILHIPMALGAVVPIANLPEIGEKPVRFSGETLAGIYLGEIVKWDDARIKADNPDLALPSKDIVVIHRSDGSGTSFIFTDYLSNVSAAWKSKVGAATAVNWPTGLGGQGNPGVTNEVKQNPYAIGYVELIYAIQQKLTPGLVKNRDGQFVAPSIESTTAAAAGLGSSIPADLRASIVNAPGAKAYPISGFTWILAHKSIPEKGKAVALTRLLTWAISDGQKLNSDLGYAPLPPEIVSRADAMIQSIQSGGGPAFPGR
ncbi:MAG: phosphate ABC transporter substrate-binding protein PstS [Chloroflexi bacterium]|nr:phosphate ABC transporter substrate-binding protein PstS [Chloroflexota bacterium]